MSCQLVKVNQAHVHDFTHAKCRPRPTFEIYGQVNIVQITLCPLILNFEKRLNLKSLSLLLDFSMALSSRIGVIFFSLKIWVALPRAVLVE